jgi:hypothetical protein
MFYFPAKSQGSSCMNDYDLMIEGILLLHKAEKAVPKVK